MNESRTSELEEKIGFIFNDKSLLLEALNRGSRKNERMEFLGDKILGFVIALMLHREFPTAKEGEMTQASSALLSNYSLDKAVHKLEIQDLLPPPKTTRNSGNSFEALIAAVFLDQGLGPVGKILDKAFRSDIENAFSKSILHPKDSLTKEIQRKYRVAVRFELLEESEKGCIVGVYAANILLGKGEATSREDAEIDAAIKALADLLTLELVLPNVEISKPTKILDELCAAKDLKSKYFWSRNEANELVCVCTISKGAEELFSGMGAAHSRKRARFLAAERVLEALKNL